MMQNVTQASGLAYVHTLTDRLRRALEQRDELRLVLAPLLRTPVRGEDGVCVFCRAMLAWTEDGHEPDCPVLRRGELLGLEPPRPVEPATVVALQEMD